MKAFKYQDQAWCFGAEATVVQRVDGCSSIINHDLVSGAYLDAALVGRAQAYMAQQDYPHAIADLSRAVKDLPNSADLMLVRGEALRRHRDYDLALADYVRALVLRPDDVRAIHGKAVTERLKGQLDLAIADFTEALRLQPGFADALESRANAYADRGDYDLAGRDYDAAVALRPRDTAPLVDRGVFRTTLGQADLAIADHTAALGLKPGDFYALLGRAQAYALKMDYTSALADLDQAAKLYRTASQVYLVRGFVRSDSGDVDGALGDFAKLTRLDPTMTESPNGRCWARATHDVDLGKAEADCEEALRLAPKSAGALDTRALLRLKLGRLPEAVADENAALAVSPRSSGGLMVRGVARRRLGDIAGGDADITEARRMDPWVLARYARFGVTP